MTRRKAFQYYVEKSLKGHTVIKYIYMVKNELYFNMLTRNRKINNSNTSLQPREKDKAG